MLHEKISYLNLGCGSRYFPEWVNVDFVSHSPDVQAHNLLHGIPFPDNSFDAVYHSHVLEHFSKADAVKFINECYRVMKPAGILRVAVPDLEQIIGEYLKNLNQAKKGDEMVSARYDWIMLELYDQTVRNTSGGEMGRYWKKSEIPEEDYIISRMGQEFLSYRRQIEATSSQDGNLLDTRPKRSKWLRLSVYRDKLIRWLTGDPNIHEYIRIGKFRKSGEVHHWMYDEYSLGRLLSEVGFKNIQRQDPFSSNIYDWDRNQWLDVEEGKPRKPDSLFMEAVK